MSNMINPKQSCVFIATYGSLRKGMQNYRVNANGGGVPVGTGKTASNFNLYRYAGCYFPSVSLQHIDNDTPVVVDVFEVPVEGMEGAYDTLEGYPSFYNRTEVLINMDDGTQLWAWLYHIDEDQEELIESGDWCKHNIPNYYETLGKSE